MAIRRFRYVVFMDDASKLCGYSAREFVGVSSLLDERTNTLAINTGDVAAIVINFARVRWYEIVSIQETQP